MLSAQEIIFEHSLYSVDIDDRVSDAMAIVNNLQLRHLLVRNGGMYYGVISEEQLLEYNNNEVLRNITDLRRDIFVLPSTNFLDIFNKMVKERLSLCPVVDNGNVAGVILFTRLCDTIIDTLHLDLSGNLIVAEQSKSEFSVSGICRILETEGYKILLTFTKEIHETGHYMVAVRTDRNVEPSTLHSFERYGINVLVNYSEDGMESLWKDRYESLMAYLNV
jgi:acetoin utilization protein AcuB